MQLQQGEGAHVRAEADGEDDEADSEEDGRRLMLCRHTAHQIMFQLNQFNLLLRGGRLFCQYIVDMFAAIDQQRLRWILMNQNKFCLACLNHLEDANMNDPDNFTLKQIGQRVFLPSSYIGGP